MKSPKTFFVLMIIFSFFISIFGSLLVFNIYFPVNNIPKSINSVKTDEKRIENSQVQEVEIKEAEIKGLKDLETNVKTIVKSVNPSVVSIIISKDIQVYRADPYGFFYEPSGVVKQKVGGGSGFFITKDGLILTNKHVVSNQNASYTIITSNNEEYVGKVLVFDPMTDLAIIKAITKEGKELNNFPTVKFINDSKSIEVGSFIIAIGNALAEFQNTVTFGVISGLERTIEAGDQTGRSSEVLSGLMQTDAAINPGNSGGPLVNLDGKVVGINTAIAAGANGLGFAIPISQKEANQIIKSVKTYGEIKRPFIGIKYISIDPNLAKTYNLKSSYGDFIPNEPGSIVSGSAGEKSGLELGDILLEADGKILKNGFSIRDIIKDKFPGDKVTLKVLKAKTGKEEYITLILGER
ncbi:trypsin-like peptidase domain-containing protein [Candidatus Gracilibacteria bacterium]|nr:trypsin-like peptidase domain-containing protein [Candidatus Gracilibacteria bacterium]